MNYEISHAKLFFVLKKKGQGYIISVESYGYYSIELPSLHDIGYNLKKLGLRI